ncbi:MAG: hypothetical protein C0595_09315 [Marinilabiliales bacterium]|nr:MAG: hypothetical protein C0595_09315 [Marinilabiliales bacterium]
MDQKFKYHYDDSIGIMFKYYYGPISIEDIESSWEYVFENDIIPKNVKGFILDYKHANFSFNIEKYITIPEFYKKHLEIFGNKKIAIITVQPKDIVIPVLVSNNDDGYISRPFSTLESAILWVLS